MNETKYKNPEKIKLAALPLRRKADREKRVYEETSVYSPFDYEVFLRQWPAEPYFNYLAAFSGPVIEDNDPGLTLLDHCYHWSKQLAVSAGHSEEKGMRGSKAIFLVPAGGKPSLQDPEEKISGTFLSYVIPTTQESSRVVSVFPKDSTNYPHFYCLGGILKSMHTDHLRVGIHPATREMLSTLDRWLSEQHHIQNSLNKIFSPTLDKFVNSVARNPFFCNRGKLKMTNDYWEAAEYHDNLPVDKYASNPFYGTGMKLNDKPDIHFVNPHYGLGEPDYHAIGTELSQYVVDVESGDDWVDRYPLHKAACENNIALIRRWVKKGYSPDQLDEDGWSPLHYACWYGEIDAVKSLIEDFSADVGVQNTAGSTPLHFAAGKGQTVVVEYLLNCTLANPGALDHKGRSPLAICLECKENDWKKTEQLLREHLQEQVDTLSPLSISMRQPVNVSHSEQLEEQLMEVEDLDYRGSLGDILDEGVPTPRKISSMSTMQLNIAFMDGHTDSAFVHKGRNTSALEALQEACHLVDLGLEYQFAFALWIVSKSLAIQLGDNDKPFRLISKWASLMKRFSTKTDETPAIHMRRNVFFPITQEELIKNHKALELLYHDANSHMLSGYYPCTEAEAVELAAISMQLRHGDHNSAIHRPGFLKDKLGFFIPAIMCTKKNQVHLERRILAKHSDITQERQSNTMLYQKYLEHCRKWPYYGCTFYEGQMMVKIYKQSPAGLTPPVKNNRRMTAVRIGINNLGFHIINNRNNAHLHSYPMDKMMYDMSEEKQVFGLKDKLGSMTMTFFTKQAPLLNSLATQMNNELEMSKKTVQRRHRVK